MGSTGILATKREGNVPGYLRSVNALFTRCFLIPVTLSLPICAISQIHLTAWQSHLVGVAELWTHINNNSYTSLQKRSGDPYSGPIHNWYPKYCWHKTPIYYPSITHIVDALTFRVLHLLAKQLAHTFVDPISFCQVLRSKHCLVIENRPPSNLCTAFSVHLCGDICLPNETRRRSSISILGLGHMRAEHLDGFSSRRLVDRPSRALADRHGIMSTSG